MRGAVITVAVQRHCAAKGDGGPFRAWPEQHRQGAEKEIVGNDDISGKLFQYLTQPLVLRLNCIDVYMLQGEAQSLGARRYLTPSWKQGLPVGQGKVTARRKCAKYRAQPLDARAHDV